jgi:hypothetical protein
MLTAVGGFSNEVGIEYQDCRVGDSASNPTGWVYGGVQR